MPTLSLDARWLMTGLGTYTLNLVRALAADGTLNVRLLTLPRFRSSLESYNFAVDIVDVPIYSIQEQYKVAWSARQSEVLHIPHYNAPLLRRGPLLATIHDLTHILDRTQRKHLKSWLYAQPMLRAVAHRANHIFTVSEYSKDQISNHLGIDPDKITVVYNMTGPHIFPEPRETSRAAINQDCRFEGPYILFVGNLKPSKNVAGLLRAFSLLRQRPCITHRLLVIGDDVVQRASLMRLAHELGVEDEVLFVPSVNNDQLRTAYSGADLTVLPSFEEGFGLPVLESMTCGTPVACSRSASLPEVAGEAAEYFDPHDVDSIATSMERALSSDRWSELRELSLKRAAYFTAERFARQHLEVYRRFLGV